MPSRFSLEYFDPAPDHERAVLTSFQFTRDESEIDDRHPGALPQLAVFLRGEGEVRFGERRDTARPGVMMLSGFSHAVPYTMRGPWHAVGVSLTPVGWAALARLSAREARDRYLHGEEAAGPALTAFGDDLVRRYTSGKIGIGEARTSLCDWIANNLSPVPAAHEALLGQVAIWLRQGLHPPVDALFGTTLYSRRQTERLVEQYFGLPPAALARKYRAIRAAALLAQPVLAPRVGTRDQALLRLYAVAPRGWVRPAVPHHAGNEEFRPADQAEAPTGLAIEPARRQGTGIYDARLVMLYDVTSQ